MASHGPRRSYFDSNRTVSNLAAVTDVGVIVLIVGSTLSCLLLLVLVITNMIILPVGGSISCGAVCSFAFLSPDSPPPNFLSHPQIS